MSKEKLPNPISEDSKVTDKDVKKKECLHEHTDEELDAMGWEKEAELWGKALVDGVNDKENHDKSN
jgi:hypothetical protein